MGIITINPEIFGTFLGKQCSKNDAVYRLFKSDMTAFYSIHFI
jgi:hypothetical protein